MTATRGAVNSAKK